MARPLNGNCRTPLAGIVLALITTIACTLGPIAAMAEGEMSADAPPINMTIKDAPIADVMRMLSEASGLNIVTGQDVTGNITGVSLTGVSVETALQAITQAAGLYCTRHGNVYLVTSKPPVPGSRPDLGVAGGQQQAAVAQAPAAPGVSGISSVPDLKVPRALRSAAVAPATPPAVAGRAAPALGQGASRPVAPVVPQTATVRGGGVPAVPPAAVSQAPAKGSATLQGVAPVAPVFGARAQAPLAAPSRALTAPVPPRAVTEAVATTPRPAAPTAGSEPSRSAAMADGIGIADASSATSRYEHNATSAEDSMTQVAAGGRPIVLPDGKNVKVAIPVKHADPASIARLLGGSVFDGRRMVSSGSRPSRKKASRSDRNSDVFGGMGGSDGTDRYWMQELGGGGLRRGGGDYGGSSTTTGRGGQRGQTGTSGGRGGTGGGIELPEGVNSLTAFMPLNTLIVEGDPAGIDQLREVLQIIDQPTRQVEISTKFLTVSVTEATAHGIDWFVSDGSLEFFNLGFAPGEASNNVVRWSRGKFEATLAVLERHDVGQIVQEPRVTAENNMEAYIAFTKTFNFFYSTVTYNEFGQRQIDPGEAEEIEIVQELAVTPRINDDDTITMFLEPIIEAQDGTQIAPDGQQYPIISSQEVSTQVTVPDGDTVVLGGMISKSKTYNEIATPLLSKIPIIGNLFKSQRENIIDTELLIFVTPRIIREIPAA